MSITQPGTTFMGTPAQRLARSRLALLGVPLDSGTHAVRGGSRLGPEAVRRHSRLLNRFDFDGDVDAIGVSGLYDAGDVEVVHGNMQASLAAVQAAVERLHAEHQVVVAVGGDGSSTLGQLRAVAKRAPGFVVVHIDAHTDAYPYDGYLGATAFTRAAEEKLLDTSRSYHLGMRGPVSVPGLRKVATDLGYNVVTMRELRKRGFEAVAVEIRERLGETPVYLCYDVDVFDPTSVPGVFTPLCDGAMPYEGLELLRCLSGLNIVHIDVNNVTPPYDVHNFTALLGAHIIWTCVDMFVRDAAPGTFTTA